LKHQLNLELTYEGLKFILLFQDFEEFLDLELTYEGLKFKSSLTSAAGSDTFRAYL